MGNSKYLLIAIIVLGIALAMGFLLTEKTKESLLKAEVSLLANYTPLLYENGTYERETLEDALKYGCGCEHWFDYAVSQSNDSLFGDALIIVCASKNVLAPDSWLTNATKHVRLALKERGIDVPEIEIVNKSV